MLYRCDVTRSTLIDSIINNYKKAIDEYRNLIEKNEVPNEDETFNVIQLLKKVSIFYTYHNMNQWNIWNSLYKDIEDAKNPSKYIFFIFVVTACNIFRYVIHVLNYRCLPFNAVKYCINACSFAILWGQNHLMKAVDPGNRGEDEYRQLKERLHSFMGLMRHFVSSDCNDAVIIYFTLKLRNSNFL